MELIKQAKAKINDIIFSSRLKIKWLSDKRFLPLTPAHKELYEIIHRLCWRELGKFPNLINCSDFNDRIQWLKLFDQDREIIRCTDKITVRDYIKDRVGEEYLAKLYQVHDHFDEIVFDSLPNSFVVKANHDSGTVVLVHDKKQFDRQATEPQFECALRKTYGWLKGEWAYSYINPKVFVEEILTLGQLVPPSDYKFHCVDGKVRWLQFIFDRGRGTKETIVFPDGKISDIHFDHNMEHVSNFELPSCWSELKCVAERLAEPFKYVRVDMYCVDSRVTVGELTFFPLMGCYKGEGQKILGKLLDFDRSTYKPLVYSPHR